jgi:hypothetical protein
MTGHKNIYRWVLKYSAIIVIVLQVAANLTFFIDKDFYNSNGFYLNFAAGTNMFIPVVLFCLVFYYNYCAVSRICAGAEVLITLYWVIAQKDDIHNILVQITLGAAALILTIALYSNIGKNKVVRFFLHSITESSCARGINKFVDEQHK